jgi:hypothetical protein
MTRIPDFARTMFRPAPPAVSTCPAGHEILDVAVRCPTCGRFVLFVPELFGVRRVRSLAQGMVIVLSAVVAFVLFGYTKEIWPLYWFLLLGVVHMYAMVFTRGIALGSATWLLPISATVSLLWAVLGGPSHHPLTTGLAGALVRAVPVLLWLLLTGYMFVLGRRGTVAPIRTPSISFLTAATSTLGFWGVWIFYLENHLETNAIYKVAVLIGLLLPVLSALILFALPDPDSMREWLLSLAALALVVLAANLRLFEPLVKAVAFIMGRLFPRLIGVPGLATPQPGAPFLGRQNWRPLVTSVMLLVAVTLVVVQATLEAARREAGANPSDAGPRTQPGGPAQATAPASPAAMTLPDEPTVSQNPTVDPSGQPDRGRRLGPAAPTRSGTQPTVDHDEAGAFGSAVFVAKFLGEVGFAIVRNIYRTLRRAVVVVLPVVTFSLLSLLIVVVLGQLDVYLRHGPFTSAVSLWGMTLTVLVAVVVLCGIAFDLDLTQRPTAWAQRTSGGPRSVISAAWRQRPRIFGIPVVVIFAGLLLASLGYFLVSLASSALLPMLWPATLNLRTLFLGDVFITNLVISVVTFGLLAGLYAIGTVRWGVRNPKLLNRYFSISAVLILMLMAGASIGFGAAPIRTALQYAARPSDDIAMASLAAQVPSSVIGSCVRDYLLLPGQTASLSCHVASTTDVSYHLFERSDDLRHWYEVALHARAVALNHGSCDRTWPAESIQSGGVRVGCYVDRRGAWLLWMDPRLQILGIAHRSDGESRALDTAWTNGGFTPPS